jgi:hypothetical protein
MIIMITPKRMRWAGHVARMKGEKFIQGFDVKPGKKETTRKIYM